MELKIVVSTPTINIDKIIKANIACRQISGSAEIEIAFADLLSFTASENKKALDLFLVSSFIYGIDRFIERHTYSIDGWSRELNVSLPVYEIQSWTNVNSDLEQLLSFLTGDYWKIEFTNNTLDISLSEPIAVYPDVTQVNLFSGGLDSLIGAIDFLNERPTEKLLLVSHYDGHISGQPEQKALREKLEEKYPNGFAFIPSVKVSLSSTNLEKEKTFRSRSLLFISLAVLATNHNDLPICVPENGTVSLNFPLSSSRRGACSTRTTHPTFLSQVNALFKKIGLNNTVRNPYDLCTKGEMVDNCKDLEFLKQIISISKSCGKSGHTVNWSIKTAKDHCGVCMPCIYRQASLQNISDSTEYGNSINKEFTGRRDQTPFLLSKQGQDFNACLDFLRKNLSDSEIRNELLINGIDNPSKLDGYVNLVQRTRIELKEWLLKMGSRKVKQKAGLQ